MSAAKVWFPAALLAGCREEAARWAPRETGGMLVGYRGEHRLDDYVVTDLVAAGPRAKRRRRRFVPDGRWQQRRLAELYTASGNVATYLGDWHSHPRGFAIPSRRDERTAIKVAETPQSRIANPLTIILAGRGTPTWEASAFQLGARRLREAALVVVEAGT